jgi:F0F1-type ATP synthase epsilon subunit
VIKVTIIAAGGIVVETEADEVEVPTIAGGLGLRGGHVPLVTALREGEITIKKSGQANTSYPVRSGTLDVNQEQVRIYIEP